jgi:aryl-alcohol dehydrogenase-like predicted oxidoreductase
METRAIGDRTVGAIGFGAMWLSIRGRPADSEAIDAIQAALDAGVTLIDTADAYCLGPEEMGHNERLVGRAVREHGGTTGQVLIATKGGHCWPGGQWGVAGRPAYLRSACEASLKRLGVESIDLYHFHHPDPQVPFEDSVAALADLQREGKVRMIGLSNVSLPQLKVARQLADIKSVENMYNLLARRDEENGLLRACEEHGIAYLAYSPLGGRDWARRWGDIPALAAVARRHTVSPQQVVLAWLLNRSPAVIPIPGGRRIERIRENATAAGLALSAADLDEIERTRAPASWAVADFMRGAAGRGRRAARRLVRVTLRH